jgi:hypothetical protein
VDAVYELALYWEISRTPGRGEIVEQTSRHRLLDGPPTFSKIASRSASRACACRRRKTSRGARKDEPDDARRQIRRMCELMQLERIEL